MRLSIVARSDSLHYQGMDRPRLGMRHDVGFDVIVRGIALEDLPPDEAVAGFRAFVADLGQGYELLALGGPGGADWELLGYDVGETTPRAWSALKHREVFAIGEPALNRHGLFDDPAAAEDFLGAYLESDDPDRDWGEDDTDGPGASYAVVPIYRLRGG